MRHHRVHRRLGIGAFFWPDPVTPINVLNRSLICHALRERQRSMGGLRRRVGVYERQQRSAQHRRGRSSADKDCDENSRIKESRLSSVLLVLHVLSFGD
jgi:hypothetical protein